ncbi:MAG: hypothetical protein AAGU21_04915 [Solidesulfovibrio sp.]|uniref:hypothetical protein n=1 Tax=Solidesulfovibrio sp. TaxID=2910990 RepID=UPI002B214194|nr:hypothetical protein [Solidesulfovibrio sp.]MEA4855945.1 hypothetical protein [Solidesulfovibrio sp.]
MAAIAAVASAVSAYQREASRLAAAVPQIGGKRVTRDAAVSIGPFSLRYSATDYEFDLTGVSAQASFPDALDAAATAARLAESGSPAGEAPVSPNATTRRLAEASYRVAAHPVTPSRPMFTARA